MQDDKCPALQAPENGYMSVTDNRVNRSVTFHCNQGYQLIGSTSIICIQDDTPNPNWSGDTPICRGILDSDLFSTSQWYMIIHLILASKIVNNQMLSNSHLYLHSHWHVILLLSSFKICVRWLLTIIFNNQFYVQMHNIITFKITVFSSQLCQVKGRSP